MQRPQLSIRRSLSALSLGMALLASGCAGVVELAEPPAEGKELVCHKGRTIEVAEAAVAAHLDHGDRRGPCR